MLLNYYIEKYDKNSNLEMNSKIIKNNPEFTNNLLWKLIKIISIINH